METAEVLSQLRELSARVLSVPEESLVPKARLIADLEADSLDFVELDAAVEDMFGVSLNDDDGLRREATYGDVVDLLLTRMAGRAPEAAE